MNNTPNQHGALPKIAGKVKKEKKKKALFPKRHVLQYVFAQGAIKQTYASQQPN